MADTVSDEASSEVLGTLCPVLPKPLSIVYTRKRGSISDLLAVGSLQIVL
eukprot:SAG11_NODE_80_length_17731_cov_13.985254_19_plen_50_part_00